MAASLQLDIICENTVGRLIPACGEHGFACLVSTPKGKWLFDTGSGATLLENFSVLGHDPADLDAVILSHGHYDHCGGLLPLLRKAGPQKIYAHPDVFRERFWQGEHEQRNVSIPFSRKELEAAGAEFEYLDTLTELSTGVFFSGVIPRKSASETGDPHLMQKSQDGQPLTPDNFSDDAALAIRTEKGLVVVLGCAHAGLINTVEYFREGLGEAKVHAIIGGTHLGPASDEQFEATVKYLASLRPDRVGVSHCTGQIRSAQLHARFPNIVFFASVGSSVKV